MQFFDTIRTSWIDWLTGSNWHVGIADCESENDSNHLTQRIDWECSVTSIGCAICPFRKRVQTENLLQDGKTIWKLFGVCIREPGCTVRYRWTSHSADDADSCEFVWEATGEHAAASSDEKKRNNAERFSHLTPLEATLLLCAPILYCAILFLILFFWSILDSKLRDVSTAHQSTHWILDTIACTRCFFGFHEYIALTLVVMFHADVGIRQAKAQLISEQLPIEEAPDMDLVVAARRRHCEKNADRRYGTMWPRTG